MVGKSLGHYEILEPLGAGGMGEVYRARDTKLDRDVAIKVLPEAVATDPDRLARFEREAKLLAALNHPNIAAIYGLDDADGKRFIAMEMVAGESLAARIAAARIPLDDALAIVRQIALALEAAHEAGVVHRDLKPANIMVTPAGDVKVLDFGLAKAYAADGQSASPDISASPTIMNATGMGMIVGTAAYMSPEQASGAPVDKRADIWAFGAVLYEMLSGGRLFQGESAAHVLADVLKTEPDLAKLAPEAPAPIRRLVRRCLSKKPDRRLHDIADARLVIDEVLAGTDNEGIPDRAVGEPARGASGGPALSLTHAGLLAGVVLVVGIAGGWWYASPSISAPEPLHVFEIATGLARMTRVALSPDGETLALIGADAADDLRTNERRLYVRRLDDPELSPVPDTEGASNAFFSPDGNWIGYWAYDVQGEERSWRLRKVSLDGASLDIRSFEELALSTSWTDDDMILFSSAATAAGSSGRPGVQSIAQISSSGGDPSIVVEQSDEEDSPLRGRLDYAERLPGGRVLLEVEEQRQGSNIVVYSPDSMAAEVLVADADTPRFVPPRYLFYGRAGSIWMAEYDPAGPVNAGRPELVTQGVSSNVVSTSYDVADDGTIAYIKGEFRRPVSSAPSERHLVAIDRQGAEETLPIAAGGLGFVRLSPDGRRVAARRLLDDQGLSDVYVYDIATGAEQRLPSTLPRKLGPIWSTDGEWVYFNAYDDRGNLYDEIQRARPGFPGETPEVVGAGRLLDVSPDGAALVTEIGGIDLGLLPVDGDGEPEALLDTENEVTDAEFSPDGRFLAYTSTDGGVLGVYVRDLETGATTPVSRRGGHMSKWSRDGKELIYEAGQFSVMSRGSGFFFSAPSDSELVKVSISVVDGRFAASAPEPFFAYSARSPIEDTLISSFDIDADGRFVYAKLDDDEDPGPAARAESTVTVILNWLDNYEQRQRQR
jgi:serine/threonine-protein kinase